MYDDLVTLIEFSETPNDMGDLVEAETRKDVFAEVRSVGMKETYQAMSLDLTLEKVFILADYLDYDGQMAIEHNGTRYKVIRTYRKENELEITVKGW